MRESVIHPLEPIYNAESKVLILGTMPSPVSRQRAFFYAHPQNRFWPVLSTLLNLPCPKDNDGRRVLCLSHGIALWDVLKSCSIDGASDASIRDAVPNDLSPILNCADIKAIFTTGKAAERYYRRLCLKTTGIPPVALPSPSAANAAMSFNTLLESYRIILPFIGLA